MPFGNILQRNTPVLLAGRLRHKIDLVQLTQVQDSTGGVSLSNVVVYANVWASIEALNGQETLAAGQELSTVSHQIVIRYIGAAPSWQALNNYSVGALCKDSNGNLQQVQSAGGLSGAAAPTWNVTQGQTTADGNPSTGLTWLNLGKAPERTGVTSAMQVWYQGRVFQILACQNADERNKSLILLTLEVNDSRQQNTSAIPTGLQ